MSRIGNWLQRRREARVSSDTNYESQGPLGWILALFALLFVIMLIWAAFLGGRAIYRHYNKPKEQPVVVQPAPTPQPAQPPAQTPPPANPPTPQPSPTPAPSPQPAPAPAPVQSAIPRTGPEDE